MTVITLMAKALYHEMQDRGLYQLNQTDCEAIMAAVLEKSGKAAEAVISAPDMGKPS